jgi:ribosomal protein RSM22 (predicted rRNA methylase)
MQVPAKIRQAVEQQLEGFPLKQLQQAAEVLSQRYRTETPTASAHLSTDLAAAAYLAVRFPATFSAVRRAMAETAGVCPEFAPATQLDAGSGPGTAVLAAGDVWPSLQQALLLEGSSPIRRVGESMVAESGIAAEWQTGDLASVAINRRFDLVTCAYVLSELSASAQRLLIERLWSSTAGVLLLVEPGTPAGWQRILQARAALLHAGAQMLAPCPHAFACPLVSPDWCHFAERVERSRMHRLVKQGDVPWEDEKFLYLAVGRERPVGHGSRVLMRPKIHSGLISLKLCNVDGTMTQPVIRKRDKSYKRARRVDWGETLDSVLDSEQ